MTNHQEILQMPEHESNQPIRNSDDFNNYTDVFSEKENSNTITNSESSSHDWLIDDGWQNDIDYSESLKSILKKTNFDIKIDNLPETTEKPSRTVISYPDNEKVIPLSKTIIPSKDILSTRIEDSIRYSRKTIEQFRASNIETIGNLINARVKDLSYPLNKKDCIDKIRKKFAKEVVLNSAPLSSDLYILNLSHSFSYSDTLLNFKVSNLPKLTPHIQKALKKIDCQIIGDLTSTPIKKLLEVKGVSRGAVSRIRKSFCLTFLYTTREKDEFVFNDGKVVSLDEGVTLSDLEKSFPIETSFELPPSVSKALKNLGCKTIGDLLELQVSNFLKEKGIGNQTIINLRNDFNTRILCSRNLVNNGTSPPLASKYDKELFHLLGNSYTPCVQNFYRVPAMQVLNEGLKKIIPYNSLSILNWIAKDPNVVKSVEDFSKKHTINEYCRLRCFLCNDGSDKSLYELIILPLEDLKKEILAGQLSEFIANLLIVLPVELDQFIKSHAEKTNDLINNSISVIPLRWLTHYELWNELPPHLTLGDAISSSKGILPLILTETAIKSIQFCMSLSSQANCAKRLISQCIKDSSKKADYKSIDIFLKRNGLMGKPMTLQEIGKQLNLTRERIRQLEQSATKKLCLESSPRFFTTRLSMLYIASKMGLAGSIKEFCSKASSSLEFDSTELEFLIRINPDFVLYAEDAFYIQGYPCMSCIHVEQMVDLVKREERILPWNIFIESLGCLSCKKESKISKSLIESNYGLVVADKCVGTKQNPIMHAKIKPESVRAQFHAILAEAKTCMTYDEILEAYEKRTGKKASRSSITSQVQTFKDCILWGRGTYIHIRNAPFPVQLLNKIADFVHTHFQIHHIPLVGVGNLYEMFKEELSSEGVPGGEALYGLLRKLDDSRLLLQEYPWICDVETVGDKTTFAKYFYSILAKNNGYISNAHAKLIAEKTMAQSWTLDGLSEYSKLLVQADGGWYNIDAAGFNFEGLRELAEEIALKMSDNDIISSKKVFKDYRERCYSLGIKSYDMLFRLINLIEDDLPITATRIPHLAKTKEKNISVTRVVRDYIRLSEHPVTHLEIIEEFANKRGIKISGLCNAIILGEDIILTSNNTYWAINNIGLNDDTISKFDKAITMMVSTAPKIKNLFYNLKQIIQSYSILPKLNNTSWTPELITEAFKRSKNFKVFGQNNNCVINLRLNPEIDTTEKFYQAIVRHVFHGRTSFDSFSEFCKVNDISTNIQPEFFDTFDNIYASNIEIKLQSKKY